MVYTLYSSGKNVIKLLWFQLSLSPLTQYIHSFLYTRNTWNMLYSEYCIWTWFMLCSGYLHLYKSQEGTFVSVLSFQNDLVTGTIIHAALLARPRINLINIWPSKVCKPFNSSCKFLGQSFFYSRIWTKAFKTRVLKMTLSHTHMHNFEAFWTRWRITSWEDLKMGRMRTSTHPPAPTHALSHTHTHTHRFLIWGNGLGVMGAMNLPWGHYDHGGGGGGNILMRPIVYV